MVELTNEDFVRALEGLTDRQRLDFALWATEHRALADHVDWGRWYTAVDAAVDTTVDDAVRAFDGLRHDGTFDGAWFFDPAFGHGLDAWRAAESLVRVMALAVNQRDAEALSSLAGAFERIGLPEATSAAGM